jgi:hypothetical protein
MSEFETKGSDPNVVEKTRESLRISATRNPKRPWWNLGGQDISFAAVDPTSVATSASGSVKDDIEGSGENNFSTTPGPHNSTNLLSSMRVGTDLTQLPPGTPKKSKSLFAL